MPLARSHIDLNADVGESFGRWRLGDDEALLGIVTSANIACGFHAGDPATIMRTCRRAVDRGVAIGAHVSYRDLAGFGRRFIDVAPDDLTADVLYQLAALDGIARTCGGRVGYVKPHGALYNAVVDHEAQAEALVAAVADFDPGLAIMGLPASAVLAAAARRGLPTITEAFADRAYRSDGRLAPRSAPGAVIHDPAEVIARVVRVVVHGRATTLDGGDIEIDAESVCVHGDTPGAAALAAGIAAALRAEGVAVRPVTTV